MAMSVPSFTMKIKLIFFFLKSSKKDYKNLPDAQRTCELQGCASQPSPYFFSHLGSLLKYRFVFFWLAQDGGVTSHIYHEMTEEWLEDDMLLKE